VTKTVTPTITKTPTNTVTPTKTPTPTVTPTVTQTLPIVQPECVVQFEITEIKDVTACDTTYIVYYLNPLAQGYISIGNGIQYSAVTIGSISGQAETVTAYTQGNGSVFVGWSLIPSSAATFSTNPVFTHTVTDCGLTYYAIFTKNVWYADFCYWSGSTFDLFTVCNTCENPVRLYYNANEIPAGLLTVHWYQNEDLTIPATNGIYTFQVNGANSTIFYLNAGVGSIGGTFSITGNCATNIFCEY
jgi:hypothetical protein